MARCCACGNSPERPENLQIVQNREGRWVTLCVDCSARGVSPENLDPAETPENHPAPATKNAAPDSRPFNNVPRVLAYLRTIRRKAELRDRTRVHPRHSVDIPIRFRLARDDAFHTGVIHDISRGGLRITTLRPLERGQHIQFDPDAALPAALAEILRESAEVRRATPAPEGRWDVGIRFVTRAVAPADNRRRHKRYQCAMRAYLLRAGSSIHLAGDVTDISQGGIQLRLDEAPERDELLEIRIRGDAGSFTRGDLAGSARVRRVIPRGAEWEVGCQFVQTKVDPRPLRERPATVMLKVSAP